MDKIIVVLCLEKRNEQYDIEVPLDISVNDLIMALNTAYNLGISTDDINSRYLRTENPIALLKGSKQLRDYKLKNGTKIRIFA